jgi:hypothetical protein
MVVAPQVLFQLSFLLRSPDWCVLASNQVWERTHIQSARSQAANEEKAREMIAEIRPKGEVGSERNVA